MHTALLGGSCIDILAQDVVGVILRMLSSTLWIRYRFTKIYLRTEKSAMRKNLTAFLCYYL